ncbi:ABC transporter substrate-binding protein [Rhizobium ruizarguesonis]|uniref:ABC transporter substrate-binding protein n=1 Tax=Rhizobium ruizarguesonis TaxID=2081791 RepID=A0AB38HTW3_9HYPH|nr:ABC transporter substrate-binding protein [Rhizobium ruizarguesonis]TBA12912.1 ABC transporter substrate-binding protein [Rhizobium ruizarguesonis]TBA52637.1 ABC transporter substrate-binding protein [Rhizobium ruizarguesonis]TBB41882.1 ABC transporter substrate-binding protein [Rhizobium ruizarguesonis]TBB57769.1 ABC transporter substrate-binding protein [Rhizobium ruizarguesonis]TBB60352.1 ABC transporter substrate-binding protein [Rhizobium ruizarguesonis]
MQHVRILRRQVVSTVAAAILMGAGWAGAAFGFEESPELKALVDAGKLPPVEKRLPKEPLVLTPLESVGTYGGTWRTATFGGGDSEIERSIGYTRLVRWNPEWTEVIPDLAKSVEVNDNATEYTFTLREGTRWSDGEPFTADDLVWWNENVLRNTKITPAAPDWLTAGGETVKVEKLADDKVVFKFAAPNGLFLMNMATVRGSDILAAAPAHYLKQFHKDFNPDGVNALVKAAGATDWVQLFNNKIGFPGRWRDLGRPTLDAWVLTAPYNGTTQVVAERNPYYAKVDTAGNQLPYFDRITIDVMQDTQAIILKAISGEIDMQNRFIETTDARTVIVQNQEKGGYGLFIARPAWSNALLITLNQTHKNPALRAVFSNKDFRIGLSYAINREELNQLIYAGQAKPYQAAPREGTALYDEKMATQYLEYNVDLANQYLDKAGLAKHDAEGYRLGQDGKRITFAIDALTGSPIQVDALEMIQRYWRAVGIDMQPRPAERSLIFSRLQNNENDGLGWVGGGGYDFLGLLDPKWYFPHEYESSFATAWGLYYQNPKDPNAQEPSPAAKKQMDLYRQVQEAPTLEKQLAAMKELLAITRDEFYVIGTNLEPDRVGIVKTNMRNVPKVIPSTSFYMTPGPAKPETFYYQQ